MPRPKAFDEATVLDRAMELFWARGYEATSITDLESHLGVGRQSLYNTFGDKHALFLHAIDRYTAQIAEGPFHLLKEPGAGLEALRAFFDIQIAELTGPGPRRACFVANTVMELGARGDGEVSGKCEQARRGGMGAFRQALRNASRAGELPRDYDVEAGATLLMTHLYGLAVMSKSGTSARELRAATVSLLDRLPSG